MSQLNNFNRQIDQYYSLIKQVNFDKSEKSQNRSEKLWQKSAYFFISFVKIDLGFDPINSNVTQWIFLLHRQVQKLELIKPDHWDRYQNNHIKNAIDWHWSHTSEIRGLSTIINFTPKKHKIRKIGYFQLAWSKIVCLLITNHIVHFWTILDKNTQKRILCIWSKLKISNFPNFVLFGCKIDDCGQTTNSHQ